MVGAGVLADDEDGVGLLEVFQKHGALADADGLFQAHAARLMAHFGAVREIVGAVYAREELIAHSETGSSSPT